MKTVHILFSFIFFSNMVFASNNPSIALSDSTDKNSISVTLKITNAKNIKDIKFNGTDNIPIIGREISFNSSSASESSNVFQSKLYLLPSKVESSAISVTANLDGKNYTSNKILLKITQQQLDIIKSNQQKQQALAKKQMQELQKQITEQMKAQQQFFNNINKLLLKQQEEIRKSIK